MEDKPEQEKQPTRIEQRKIEQEMKQSYLDYSMSVIVGRALPDVRDGLKPVQRRVLYSILGLGLLHNRPFRKSARIVGDCLGRFHPHSDIAVYDAMVRMAQDFSLRYPLVDGQGNWGCFTGDTKIKLSDGRDLSFKDLVKEHKQGKRNYTYTLNSKGFVEIVEIKNPRLTKRKEKVMKVILDNGKEVRCTLDHLFMLRDGTYKEAQKLRAGDSLMPLYLRPSTEEDAVKPALVGYQMVYQPKKDAWVGCHVLADNWNIKHKVYAKSAGRIRHHTDFNKLNNNPENIKRIQWRDHWTLHVEHASQLHKSIEYCKKIADGRRRFWSDKRNREKAAQMLSERNRRNWQDPEYQKFMSKVLSEVNIEFSKKHPELREEKSKRLRKLWNDKRYQEFMSILKSKEMKERWEKNDPSLRRFTSEESKKIWAMPGHREFISRRTKERWQDEEYRNKMSDKSRKKWKDEEYRKKFSENHFSKMAEKLWQDPRVRKLHHDKAVKQWQNPEFRERFIAGVKSRNKQRLSEDPEIMKKLAAKAKVALRKKWQDTSYKEKVVKSRILYYVNSLTKKYSQVTPEIYEKERYNNCLPRIRTALKYFGSFSEIVAQAETYNHKVVKIEILTQREDVYDLTIGRTHNFALAAGVFVHNSIDGDNAAAIRYTEARLMPLAEELLADIDKETVKFVPNFDNSLKEPVVLPSKAPNLLVNGCSGIAVGMATNIPPHNFGEVIDGLLMLINNPNASVDELMQVIKGPDFPTAAIIYGYEGIRYAYKTGRGVVRVRAKVNVDEAKHQIIVSEVPFQINKAQLVEQIADLVNEKKVRGISDLRDESSREGIRVVITLSRDANPRVVLNQLFKHSRLESSFGINMVALVNNQPRLLNLKEMLQYFIEHRKSVVTKRTSFELKRASERDHILEGIILALERIDDVVNWIKKSKDTETAKSTLIQNLSLTQVQASAILDMKLQRLSSFEQERVHEESKKLKEFILELKAILADEKRVFDIIKKELLELKQKYADNRRTLIEAGVEEFEKEDLIQASDVIVTITHNGYIKRTSPKAYRTQQRGGKGVIAAETRQEDFVEDIFIANTHSYLLLFTNLGVVHWLKVYEIPEASRYALGTSLMNLVKLQKGEKITALIPVKSFESGFLFMATKKGVVKKVELNKFSRPRRGGIIATRLDQGDSLIGACITDGNKEIILATAKGMAIHFKESDIRILGRNTRGVRGIRLRQDDEVIAMVIADPQKTLLSVTENGYGKRSNICDYRLINRGGRGVINIKTKGRNGLVVDVKSVEDNDDLMFISKKGKAIKLKAKDISIVSRNTQGVTIMRLKEGDKLVAAAKIKE